MYPSWEFHPQGPGKKRYGRVRPSPGLAYSIGYLNATLKAVLSNKKRKA